MPKLYSLDYCPSVRSVLLTAKAIGLDLEIITIDLGKKEQLSEAYLAKNPQHTVPTFEDDDGFVIWDSHAIMIYIVEKYANDDALYPKDLKTRAIIHQRMHFDTMSAVTRSDAINPLFHAGATSVPEELAKKIREHYSFLNKFLEKSSWLAGDSVTLADFSLLPSVALADVVVPIDQNLHPKLSNWLREAQKWEYYGEHEKGHEGLKALILERIAQ